MVFALLLILFNGISHARIDDSKNLRAVVDEMRINELDDRIRAIDQRLSQLAAYNLRSGVGAIGYRSLVHLEPDHTEWIEIELQNPEPIREVFLVPCVLREKNTGFVADAMPSAVTISVGEYISGEDGTETWQANGSFEVTIRETERIAPFAVDIGGTRGSRVRIECSNLPARERDGKHLLQLAEVMVFSNRQNLALNRPVRVSSNGPNGTPAWDSAFLVDGFVPYLMNSVQGLGSFPVIGRPGKDTEAAFTIDLEQEYEVNQISIHLVDQADTVPQSFNGDFGVPGTLTITGATTEDFSDEILLAESRHNSSFDWGPIRTVSFASTRCRYIRFICKDPYVVIFRGNRELRVGFAEIEVFSDGINCALHRSTTCTGFAPAISNFEPLTDGNNRYGRILPVRVWMSQLAERHELEYERPILETELKRRYARQSGLLRWLAGLAIGLGLLAVGIVLIARRFQQLAVKQTREQIAADIHDELGANLLAIGLLSDFASDNSNDPSVQPVLARIRQTAEKSAKTARDYVKSNQLTNIDAIEEMKRSAARISIDIEHQFIFSTPPDQLPELTARENTGLVLFHKECLTNVIRHSNATTIETRISADEKDLILEVVDNGTETHPISGPRTVAPSLIRRARLTGGKVALVNNSPGTHIVFRLAKKSGWLNRLLRFDVS